VTGAAVAYPGGPLEVLVNNTKYGGESPRAYSDFTTVTTGLDTTFYSELPDEGTTEVWEIVNLTADAHPIHLHLVQFQIINRHNFDFKKYNTAYDQAFPPVDPNAYPDWAQCTGGVLCPGFGPPKDIRPNLNPLSGGKWGGNPDVGADDAKGKFLYLAKSAAPPLPEEAGWKDTVVAYPGQVTRLAVRWAPTDLLTTDPANMLYYPFDPRGTASTGENYAHGYVWLCHIVDHDDNEMMRPFSVALNAAAPTPPARPLVKGPAGAY
jgi:FtsP/CotA-like multicopper oxidase with cupredoxin domain